VSKFVPYEPIAAHAFQNTTDSSQQLTKTNTVAKARSETGK